MFIVALAGMVAMVGMVGNGGNGGCWVVVGKGDQEWVMVGSAANGG